MFTLEDKVLIGTGTLMLGSVVILGGTLAIGVVTGLMSAIALGIILVKVRTYYPRIWLLICKHPIASDIVISGALFFLVASSTATGVVAGAASGLFASMGLNLGIRFLDKKQIP